MNDPISEKELQNILYYNETRQIQHPFWLIVRNTFSFLVVLTLAYLLINISAVKDRLSFWYKYDYKAQTVNDEGSKIIVSEKTTVEAKQEALPDVLENHIYIPLINVNAPITWRVKNDATDVANNLENGVIQIDGTALPGEKGNIYITGHSSNFIWAKGNYNTIFSLMGNLVVGDVIYIRFNSITYVYKVNAQEIVSPTQLSVLDKGSNAKLSLVTCWPIGTSLKRMVLLADQIYPDPSLNVANQNISNPTKLVGGL